MSAIRVARELNRLSRRELEHLLELAANVHEHFLALLHRSSLATCNIAVTAAWDALADCAGPDTDTVEALSDIDYDAHELAIIFLLECLADSSQHNVEPELVDGYVALLLELVGPLAAVLVLDILPFGADAFLEEVVIGLEGQFGGGSNVVLELLDHIVNLQRVRTYVDTPEFLNRIEGDDFLQQIIPVVALQKCQ
jgi:hypothetical protein